MNDDFARFLQISVLTLWNLFPNGTMIFATWLSCHDIDVLPQDEEQDDFWIPHFGK